MAENNQYWEQVVQRYQSVSEEDIIKRIKECQFVIDKLENDELWRIIIKDVNRWVETLDKNWQDIRDEKHLDTTRVLKNACIHLKNLKEGYVTDWKIAQDELERRRDPNVIEKDMEN